ncbi:hypothetical protein [Aeromonas salmonicida]|nr:hypothetical protein [Aeromonas salmonicida]
MNHGQYNIAGKKQQAGGWNSGAVAWFLQVGEARSAGQYTRST